MKRFTSVILLLSLSASFKTMAAAVEIPESGDSSVGAVIFLTGSLLILVLLVLWLLKSSYHLKETIDDVNTDGKNWLNNHLKDLDSQQVNILIKRQHEVRSGPVKDENQNKQ
jgi:anionic cell wall polymer biosynthesis LytR-Cps2A-Psr (LCP) family protein